MFRKSACAVLLSVLALSPAAGQEWARKMFKVTRHDFGSVARGAKAEYEFTLTNLYLEDVHIASVRSSCGCTSPTIKTPWLKTYEQGAILAVFNTGAFLGQRGATVTVTIDKPFYAEVQLQVAGYIRSDVVLDPGSVQLGSVNRGTPVDAKIAVNYAGRSDWKILSVKSLNPHLTARVAEKSRYGGQVSYQLFVHLDGEVPAGYVHDQLVLVTNDLSGAQVPVTVEGRVLSSVTVSPGSLFLGVVQPGQKVTKQLVVKGTKPFRIRSVNCEDGSFTFGAPAADTPKPLHLIPVTFTAGDQPGKVSQKIRIETDLDDNPPELSAYAVVAAQ